MKEQIFYIISCLVLAQETLIKGVFPMFNRERDESLPQLDIEDWWGSVEEMLDKCRVYLSQPEMSSLEEYFSDIKDYIQETGEVGLDEFEEYIQGQRPVSLMCATLLTPNSVLRDPHWKATEVRAGLAESLNPDHHQFIEELVDLSSRPLQLNNAWRFAVGDYGEGMRFPDMSTEEDDEPELVT